MFFYSYMLRKIESYFEFTRLGTHWRTEILAGVTTFITMAYIVLVNPSILSAAGIPLNAATAATCLSAAFASIMMGVVARYPIALAPGMGLNAYFTYTVCLKMHVPWQTALGAVFISGIIFFILAATNVQKMILHAIPHELYAAVASGIGLFIAFIGFRNAGLVIGDTATLVGMGSLRNPSTALALAGLILMVALEIRRVKGAIVIGVIAVTVAAWLIPATRAPLYDQWAHSSSHGLELGSTFMQLDIKGALGKGLIDIIFVFFFVDLFDNLGTLMAVTKRAGLIADDNKIPRLNRILMTDAVASMAGAMTGTSTVTSYVESTAGVMAGGRSGVTAVVTGLLFLGAIATVPFVGMVPAAATAPALILVGSLMLSTIAEIRWRDPLVAVPAFLTLVLIPLTYSIANGLGFGVISWAILHVVTGKLAKKDWLLYLLAVLFLVRFLYLGSG